MIATATFSSLSRCAYPEVFLSGKRSQVPAERALLLATPLDEVYRPWVAGIIGAGVNRVDDLGVVDTA